MTEEPRLWPVESTHQAPQRRLVVRRPGVRDTAREEVIERPPVQSPLPPFFNSSQGKNARGNQRSFLRTPPCKPWSEFQHGILEALED
eukprot:1571438-Pyramimonas_sp.AAC.1